MQQVKTNIAEQIRYLHTNAVAQHKAGKIEEAISLYLAAIEVDENQPAWIYGNVIILLSQVGRLDEGLSVGEKAEKIHPESDEIYRSIALLLSNHKSIYAQKSQLLYLKSIDLNHQQPEWVYIFAIKILLENDNYHKALNIKKRAEEFFPRSDNLREILNKDKKFAFDPEITYLNQEDLFTFPEKREVHSDIEDCVDINISRVRRRLIDSAIVEKYQTILSQMLLNINDGVKKMDQEALIRCLAEIKTDIHYIKTKLFQPSPEAVDPQAKNGLNLDKIILLPKPVPIIIDLKKRIVGSGWYEPEQHGRWSGPGTISSVILPYPVASKYRLEVIVKSEAKSNILEKLRINFSDQPIEINIISNSNNYFPAVVQGEIEVTENHSEPFIVFNFLIDKTFSNQDQKDQRLLGLLIETVSLIPC